MIDVSTLRDRIDPFRARVAGAFRRMQITLTAAKAIWQFAGHTVDGVREVAKAEMFTGIGFYARPPTTGKPEAIVANLQDAEAPVIVAIRDEKTRAAAAGNLAANETAAFNTLAILHLKADGTIEARPVGGGPAVSLALKSDVDNLRSYVMAQFSASGGHVHSVSGAATVAITTVAPHPGLPTVSPLSVVGTNTLMGC